MGVVVIDGSTVRDFVEDEEHFNRSIDERFSALDLNKDGVLSRSELRIACESLHVLETHFGVGPASSQEEITRLYDEIFDNFDCDKNGTIEIEEFRSEMKKIMLAIADGLGSSPITMVLEDGEENLLKQAADHELAKLHEASQEASSYYGYGVRTSR